eukprot:COSAG06_NODE_47271_length_340_cov_0.858921_1_plen_60_part_01
MICLNRCHGFAVVLALVAAVSWRRAPVDDASPVAVGLTAPPRLRLKNRPPRAVAPAGLDP